MPRLRRIRDGAGDAGQRSEAWKMVDENGKADIVLMGDRPMIGCSMLVGAVTARSYADQDYWVTTLVTAIIEDTPNYVRFKTGNSEYEWSV